MAKEPQKPFRKYIGFIIIIALIGFGYFFFKSNPGSIIKNIFATGKIKVMTYNIHHGTGSDGKYDLQRIISVIREQSPHFVCLNQVDYKMKRANGDDQARIIAAELGMYFTFARNMELQSGYCGNSILSKFPIEFAENKLLFNRNNSEQWGMLHIIVNIGDRRVHIYTTHLSPDSTESSHQMDEVLNVILGWGVEEPAIVAGDMNLGPQSDKIHEFSHYFNDYGINLGDRSFTYPSNDPNQKIDYIFSNRLFSAVAYQVIKNEQTTVASDHLPIVGIYNFND